MHSGGRALASRQQGCARASPSFACIHEGPSRRSVATRAIESPSSTEMLADGVTIRRRPPRGSDTQPCGPFDYRVRDMEDNKPANILEEIVWYKARELDAARAKLPLPALRALALKAAPPRDFRAAIARRAQESGRPGLIAEVKKASPSKGVIQPDFDPVRIAKAYEAGGAACLSILTDEKFFQGSFDYLRDVRAAGVSCPLLAKEFIVEAYQLFKARASGADAALLIAAVLPNSDLAYLIKVAETLALQVLVEVHTEAELARVLRLEGIERHVVGINNRDLQTFEVDLANTERIMASAPGKEAVARGIPVVGESGIFVPADVARVQAAGCGAILVGESLVKQGDPEAGCKALLA